MYREIVKKKEVSKETGNLIIKIKKEKKVLNGWDIHENYFQKNNVESSYGYWTHLKIQRIIKKIAEMEYKFDKMANDVRKMF